MRQNNIALALLAAAVLAACGGGSSTPTQPTKIKFAAQVTFGDSLSDVGSYAVGPILAGGGGKFTINGDNTAINPTLTGKNWTELIATQIGVAAPCAAVTGLEGTAPGFAQPITPHTGCFGYAMGGSRVTNPVGAHNKAIEPTFGALTYPVSTQLANHLALNGGKFKGDELVLMMAGGNDLLALAAQLTAEATAAGNAAGAAAGATAFATSLTGQLAAGAPDPAAAAQAIGLALQTEAARPGHTDSSVVAAAVTAAVQQGNVAAGNPAVYGPMVATAQADALAAGNTAGAKAGADYAAANAPKFVQAMMTSGAEMSTLALEAVAHGANYVVVNNLPDVSATPSALSQSASSRTLIKTMVEAFNSVLKSGVAGEAKILYVDVYAAGLEQVNNPGAFGITNLTTPACTTNFLGSITALGCTRNSLIPGDISHYLYADDVHPTPYGYSLIARYVTEQMTIKGWL
jgi:phospholipase/lecithinase/hemolysin